MPPKTQGHKIDRTKINAKRSRLVDKDGYYRLGYTTLYYFFIKYSVPAFVLFFIELILVETLDAEKKTALSSMTAPINSTVESIMQTTGTIIALLLIIAVVYAIVRGYISYWSFRYKTEYNYFSFVLGLINHHKISIPFHQIQNVDIDQNILYRIFGLVSLVILTSGHEDPQHMKKEVSEITLPPMNTTEGLNLQQHLLDRSNVQRIITQDREDESVVSPPLE